MGWTSILIAVFVAVALVAGGAQAKGPYASLRVPAYIAAIIVLFLGVALSSIRFVPADRVGIVTKNALGDDLPAGRVIAVNGEKGVQAEILPPGWHLWLWPVIYDVKTVPLVEVTSGEVGIVEAIDGNPLSPNQVFADEMEPSRFKTLLEDPVAFLGEGGGQKGPQTSVLTPGLYRINTELFKVTTVPQTDVAQGTVAVLKSNVGGAASKVLQSPDQAAEVFRLAGEGEKGVRESPLLPGRYPLNPNAFGVNEVSTKRRVANYADGERADMSALGAISVKSQDGFTFPVDVRVVYYIKQEDAPRVVALLGGDNAELQQLLTSRVRAIFRDNAESVSALDYINQRTTQATNASQKLRDAMSPYGVTVESIDIGDVGGDNQELANLLDTQRQRKIAQEEEQTFIVQQQAAEQEKELKRTRQEAEEERRLATARYEVQIAEQQQEQRVIQAKAEAEAIRIRAEAEAEAYRRIAEEIGPANLAMIELLKIVGDRGINITPRVLITGGAGGGNGEGDRPSGGLGQGGMTTDAQTAALIGTMLDSMVQRDLPERERRRDAQPTGTPTGPQSSARPTREGAVPAGAGG
jgi:uncharacterized membrane protein YqiK